MRVDSLRRPLLLNTLLTALTTAFTVKFATTARLVASCLWWIVCTINLIVEGIASWQPVLVGSLPVSLFVSSFSIEAHPTGVGCCLWSKIKTNTWYLQLSCLGLLGYVWRGTGCVSSKVLSLL
jgi:hypothetical protein